MDAAMITALVGLFGAVIGTLGTKMVDVYMTKKVRTQDLASQIRSEQRAEVLTLRSELDDTEEQLDEWKDKYYELKQENARQQIMLDNLQDQLNELKEDARATKENHGGSTLEYGAD